MDAARRVEAGMHGQMSEPRSRGQEITLFLLLTVVLFPALAVAIVGGWGFLVWMYQLIAGPPGPPPL